MNKIRQFFGEVQSQLHKSTWPTKQELKDSTIIILITMVMLGFFVGCIDFVFSKLMLLLVR